MIYGSATRKTQRGPQVGDALPTLTRQITQEKINLYAAATGDFNPLHIDPEFARHTPFGGTIAHGMMGVAFVSSLLTAWAGKEWVNRGKMRVRFVRPMRPGDTVVVRGQITAVKEEGEDWMCECRVECVNQDGRVVVEGWASVPILRESRG